jgi:hypothetical protein
MLNLHELLAAHNALDTFLNRNKRRTWNLLRSESPTRTHLGGLPNLPDDVPWPRFGAHVTVPTPPPNPLQPWRDLRRPDPSDATLALLAQIDLAEMPTPSPLPLPTTGLLQFYWMGNEHVGGGIHTNHHVSCVIYAPDPGDTPLRTPPTGTDVRPLVHLTGHPDVEIGMPDFVLHGLYDGDGPFPTEAFWTDHDARVRHKGCRIGGYPEAMEVNHWASAAAQYEELHGITLDLTDPMDNFHLLLHLPTGRGDSGLVWPNHSHIYWWIRWRDLVDGRWDRVWLSWDPED